MTALVDILHSGNYSLVVSSAGEIHTFTGRGISDLYGIFRNLNGAELADKVVGKGAAALMVLGRVGRVHADVISRPALALLKENGVEVSFSSLVDNIINRQGSGLCPVEALCLDCPTAEDCLPEIIEFMSKNG